MKQTPYWSIWRDGEVGQSNVQEDTCCGSITHDATVELAIDVVLPEGRGGLVIETDVNAVEELDGTAEVLDRDALPFALKRRQSLT